MDSLIKTLAHSRDIKALDRIGFHTNFTLGCVKNLGETDPLVVEEGTRYMTQWKLIFEVFKARAGTMTRHTSGHPGMWAGLMHENDDNVQNSMDMIREMADAYTAAARAASPTVMTIVGRCFLGTTAAQWCLKFCQASEWREPTRQFVDFLKAMYHGFCQTKIAEDVIGFVRDKETRASPSKDVAYFSQWHSAVSAKLMEKYGRPEPERCIF